MQLVFAIVIIPIISRISQGNVFYLNYGIIMQRCNNCRISTNRTCGAYAKYTKHEKIYFTTEDFKPRTKQKFSARRSKNFWSGYYTRGAIYRSTRKTVICVMVNIQEEKESTLEARLTRHSFTDLYKLIDNDQLIIDNINYINEHPNRDLVGPYILTQEEIKDTAEMVVQYRKQIKAELRIIEQLVETYTTNKIGRLAQSGFNIYNKIPYLILPARDKTKYLKQYYDQIDHYIEFRILSVVPELRPISTILRKYIVIDQWEDMFE